jgi:predicted AlkP superfamily pyrophosphatase or phosphodiesterase
MKNLYIYLFIIVLLSNIAIAQTNNDSSLGTLNTNEVYPEATFERNDEDRTEKIWITWPDGRKELVSSLYSDDAAINKTERFYVILTNNVKQIVTLKDEKILEEINKINKEKLKKLEIRKRAVFRDKILIRVSLFLFLSIPIILFYLYCSKKRKI